MEFGAAHTLLSFTVICCLIILTSCGSDSPESVQPTTSEPQLSNEEYKTSNSTEFQAEKPSVPRDFQLGPKIVDWDEQRAKWLQENPRMRLTRKGKPRIILATSSQTEPCASRFGDHYLLKSAKNKIDYARLHDIQIYYNMVVINPVMTDFFIKHPLVRNLMLTHPEAEWIWWMDSDAMFTDMSFEIPLQKYKDHNLIVHGWDDAVYERKNWVGLNAGIFLIRNCQWSLDMLDTWSAMGADYGDNKKLMGTLTSQTLDGRPDFGIDDQSALVYLLTTSRTDELKSKVFLESSYSLHGYWVWAIEKIDSMFKDTPERGAKEDEYWPFITHFVGCKSCSGSYASYPMDVCLAGMERAFNLADNQVLQMYGVEHENLTSSDVKPTKRKWRRPVDFLCKSPLQFLRRRPWTPTRTASLIKKVRVNSPA